MRPTELSCLHFQTVLDHCSYEQVYGCPGTERLREHYKKGVNGAEHTGRLRPRFGAFSQKGPFTVNPKALLIL